MEVVTGAERRRAIARSVEEGRGDKEPLPLGDGVREGPLRADRGGSR